MSESPTKAATRVDNFALPFTIPNAIAVDQRSAR